jgi:hypothetical protein
MKEHAVKTNLDKLDEEMKSVEFEFQNVASGTDNPEFDVIMVMKLPDLVSQFEEFYLRASVTKSNPHIKNFIDRLNELEKIIVVVLQLVNEW